MYRETLFYIAGAASALGSWMTFLAVALFVNEKFGADKVAYAFLISSMPALLLSRSAVNAIPIRHQKKSYLISLFLMAVNVLLLIRADSLWNVYFYLLVASCISAFAKPLLDTLIAESFEKAELDRVLTKAGSLSASILCIAPPIGASLATSLGYSFVYVVDAVTFCIAAILFLFVFKGTKQDLTTKNHESDIIKKQFYSMKEISYPSSLRKSLFFWYSVLVLGALINAGEFGLFNLASYTKSQIGYVVGAWGVGGLVAFLTAGFQVKTYINKLFILYGVLLGMFYQFPQFWFSCFVFAISGLLSAKIGGNMRAIIQSRIPQDIRSLEVWGLVNSRLSLINMLVYSSVGFLIPYWGVQWITLPLLLVAILTPLFFWMKFDQNHI